MAYNFTAIHHYRYIEIVGGKGKAKQPGGNGNSKASYLKIFYTEYIHLICTEGRNE